MSLSFQTFGNPENKPLVFLHGFLGSASDWIETFGRSLVDDYYCIAFDLPGHGQTEVENELDYRMENTAGLLVEQISNYNQVDLISYSMGGRLAYFLAVNFPRKFGKIVIESATPGLKIEEERITRIENDKSVIQKLKDMDFNDFLDFWHGQTIFSTIDRTSMNFEKMFKRRIANKPEILIKSLKHMGAGAMPSLWDQLDKIKSNLLLIAGEKDAKFCKIVNDVDSVCAGAVVKIMPGAGHNVHFEKPLEYIKIVNKFLKKKRI